MDGTDDAITVVDFGYGPDYTVQFWFQDTSNTATEYLYSHGDDGAANSINVVLNGTTNALETTLNGTLLFSLSGSAYSDLLDGARHMYTITVDDNFAAGGYKKVAYYIDGQQVAVDTSLLASSFNPINNIIFGRKSLNTAGTYFG